MPKRTRRSTLNYYTATSPKCDATARSAVVSEILADLGSVVYFVRAHGLVKIGYTTHLRNRISSYGASLTDLLLVEQGGRAEELAYHRRFAADLARGREWFRPSVELLAYINEARARLNAPPVRWSQDDPDLALLADLREAEAEFTALHSAAS